jgi:hypothetical protein
MRPEEFAGVGVEGEDAALAGDVAGGKNPGGFGEAPEVAASGFDFPNKSAWGGAEGEKQK